MTLRIRSALLCDDVRMEAETSKHILIGVCGTDISTSTRPAVFQARLFVSFETEGEPVDVDMEVAYNRINVHKMSVPPGFSGANAVIPLSIIAMEEKDLVLRYRFNEGEWSDPIQWKVRFADNAIELPPENVANIRAMLAEVLNQDQSATVPEQPVIEGQG